MSTKVSVENRAENARPFAWRTVAITGETRDRRRVSPETRLESKSEADANRSELEGRLSELEETIATRERAAHESGLREGEAAATAQAESEIRPALERLAQSIAQIDEYRSRLHRQAEVDAVRLSVAIARRVLRREL